MSWKEYILSTINSLDQSSYSTCTPASIAQIEQLKNRFGLQSLPEELEELYRKTNGIETLLDGMEIGPLIWSVERTIETNEEMRTYPDFKELYMSFDQLLFFADAGNGDLFAFITLKGAFHRHDILVWDHENDSRRMIAPNLSVFLSGWTGGTIKI